MKYVGENYGEFWLPIVEFAKWNSIFEWTLTKKKVKIKNVNLIFKFFLQVEEGCENELTEFDIKKKEKEEKVAELREKLAALKEKESETKEKFDSEKAALDVHR